MKKEKITAIVLAAGTGKRMQSDTSKQYMLLMGKPLIYYALYAFEQSAVDEVVLVTGKDEIEYCTNEIVHGYGLKKVKAVVAGGKERYHSVYQGLMAAAGSDYALIHDGARPFLTQDIIARVIESVRKERACVAAMPAKDTVKIADQNLYAAVTPPRKDVWMVQTPQAFSYELIQKAYDKVVAAGDDSITDDAMVLEKAAGIQVKLVEGSYKNIKITTPEDMEIAEVFVKDIFYKKI